MPYTWPSLGPGLTKSDAKKNPAQPGLGVGPKKHAQARPASVKARRATGLGPGLFSKWHKQRAQARPDLVFGLKT